MRGGTLLGAVLLLSLGLNVAGIGWGLPSVIGWAPDELIPAEALAGARRHFSGGWHHAYPPFHFYVLAAAYAPILAASDAGIADTSQAVWRRQWPGGTYLALFLAGRAVSLLMAAGTLIAVHRAALLWLDRAGAAFAALVLALSLPFVFYSKLANVDLPYTFWFSAALLSYLRILARHDLKDYLAFSAAAVLSVCTKDQAWALYPLPALHVLMALRGQRRRRGDPAAWKDVLTDQRIVCAVLLALFLFLAGQNIPFNARGFVEHVKVVTGPLNRDLQMFGHTVAGEWRMARLTARLLAFALGAPAMIASVAGLARAALARPRPTLLLSALVPAASYAAFFLAVALVGYDRFMLPLCVVAALFAGHAVSGSGAAALPAAVRAMLAAAVVAFGLLRAVALDGSLRNDARYAAEDWMAARFAPQSRIAAVGPLAYLPRLERFDWFHAPSSLPALERLRPDAVVVNADYEQRPEEPGGREFYQQLEAGALGYRRVFQYRAPARWPLDLRWWTLGREGYTNLAKVNPEVVVFLGPENVAHQQ